MHLFDPSRPEVTPGIKAILTDGSAMPHMVCQPRANGTVRVACLLRNYDTTESYSYAYRETSLTPTEVKEFFEIYASDPEYCFYNYFKWVPKTPGKRSTSSIRQAGAAAPVLPDLTNLL